MTAELHELPDIVAKQHIRLNKHEQLLSSLRQDVDGNTKMVMKLEADQKEILRMLENTAKSSDILDLRKDVRDTNTNIFSLMRDALAAVPPEKAAEAANRGNIWLAIAAIVSLVALVVSLVHG